LLPEGVERGQKLLATDYTKTIADTPRETRTVVWPSIERMLSSTRHNDMAVIGGTSEAQAGPIRV
jgi:hypothetical protein